MSKKLSNIIQKKFSTDYKTVFIDLDGTLVTKKYTIPKLNKQAINKLKLTKTKIVIATGRPVVNIIPILKKLDLFEQDTPVIAFNGSLIYKPKSKTIINSKTFSYQEISTACKLANKHKIQFWCFKADDSNSGYRGKVKGLLTFYLPKRNKQKSQVFDFKNEFKSYKFTVGGSKKQIDAYKQELNQKIKCNIFHITSQLSGLKNNDCFEAAPVGASKASGAKHLLEQWKINNDDTVAIGDSYNDISLLQYVGLGIAMGNAEKQIKESADEITLSNKYCGLAYAINKFILK